MTDAISCGPLWVSPEQMCEVRFGTEPLRVAVAHLTMLKLLLEAGGRIVTRDELYGACGGGDLPEGSRRVDVNIARLRRSLGPAGPYLVSVRGKGYRINVARLKRARPASEGGAGLVPDAMGPARSRRYRSRDSDPQTG